MQLLILLKKDLTALFKQKAIIFTLLIPMLMIIGLGVLPTIIGVDDPVTVGILNQDNGIEGLNLGQAVSEQLEVNMRDNQNIETKILSSYSEFEEQDNVVFFPGNFSKIANSTRNATYYIKISDSDLRANSVMNSVIEGEIEKIVREELLSVKLPEVENKRIYTGDQVTSSGNRQNRAQIAFPLAYMSFLILILSSSSMRVTGFSAEREANMVELLLASVIDRKELVLSKLLTGVTYGFASVMSYVIGIIVVFLFQGNTAPTEEVSFLIFPPGIIEPSHIFFMFLLFADLSFIAIQILLSLQLVLGKEAGDRLGSMAMMIMAFLFYFSTIGDPLAQGGLQVLNPFFWPFRITLNLIFGIDWILTLVYLGLNIMFSWYLLRVKVRAIEREQVIFE